MRDVRLVPQLNHHELHQGSHYEFDFVFIGMFFAVAAGGVEVAKVQSVYRRHRNKFDA